MFIIQLGDITGTTIEALNQKLYDLGWNQKESGQPFKDKAYYKWQFQDFFNNLDGCAEKANQLDYANSQRLMLTGGEDRDCTYEECLAVYGNEMKENQLYLDIKFDRGSRKSMIACALFASGKSNQGYIEFVKNGKDLLNKSKLTLDEESQKILDSLERVDKDPEMLPEDERMDRSIQGGTLLARYWSPAPDNFVHIIFGNVEDASFLKNRQHVDSVYDSLYRCDDKRAVLMVPQIPFGEQGAEVAKNAFYMAATLGVTENPNYFIHMVWKNAFALPEDGKGRKKIAASFNESYTIEELEARFMTVVSHLNNHYPTYRRAIYNPKKATFNRWSYQGNDQDGITALLNCLYQAIWNVDKDAAFKVVSEADKTVTV